MNDLMIEILSKFTHIIVPNSYNKVNFLNQGLNTKIDVVPLFCDTDIFVYKNHDEKNKFVFGISNEDPRKNLNKVIKCFAGSVTTDKSLAVCGQLMLST
jgi:glycosyltransferase involved in cell wall biosynthesis